MCIPIPCTALEVADYLKIPPRASSMPIVGLNPIGFCDPRIWPRKDDSVYQDYLKR